MITYTRGRIWACSALVLVVLAAVQCTDTELLAPDGSHIDVASSTTVVATDGDTAIVTALVTEADGHLVDDNTKVTFIASNGSLCALPTAANDPCASNGGASVVTAGTRSGIASAGYRSGAAPATVTIKARSGSIENSTTLTVSGLVAPAGAKVTVDAAADTVDQGKDTAVQAFVSTSDGTAVPDNTRVVVASADTAIVTIQHTILLTHQGFVSAVAHAKKTGSTTIEVASGTVHGQHTLVVR